MNLLMVLLLALSPCPVRRDAHGHIVRSWSAVHVYLRSIGYPHGKPGTVVDHRWPLCGCGPDQPMNMQAEDRSEAKRKDREEVRLCREIAKGRMPAYGNSVDACKVFTRSKWPLLRKANCR